MSEPAAEPQRPGPFGIALLTFRVEHFRGIQEQREFAAHQREPLAGMSGDEIERASGPVIRNFSWREGAASGMLGELGRVLTLILGRSATVAQCHVSAVGLWIVTDIEIRSELRRRQVETAGDGIVPNR